MAAAGGRPSSTPATRNSPPASTSPAHPAAGRGGGKASNSGEGMDDFVFQITQEEFLDFMFEDLEPPNLVKRHITGTDTFKTVRAGISNDGNPSRINIVRTLRSAHARRIALSGGSRAKLRAALKELERIKREEPDNLGDIQELELEIAKLRARIDRVPFLDTFDLKYNLLVKQPNPTSKAVMFCLMDVSGSMTQATRTSPSASSSCSTCSSSGTTRRSKWCSSATTPAPARSTRRSSSTPARPAAPSSPAR